MAPGVDIKYYFSVNRIKQCEVINAEESKYLRILIGIILGISVLCGTGITPLLIHHLKGPQRCHLVLQQFCIILYLCFHLVQLFLSDPSNFLANILSAFNVKAKEYFDASSTYYQVSMMEELCKFMRVWAYFAYYWLSMLHSYDVNIMVCQPFNYHTFSKPKKVWGRILVGFFCCILASSEELLIMIIKHHFLNDELAKLERMEDLRKKDEILYWTQVFRIVKLILVKSAYGVTNLRICKNIKQCLDDSDNMTNNVAHKKPVTLHHDTVCIESSVYCP